MARLLSLNVGLPRDIAWQGRTVHTSVWKTPVQGPRMARRLNLDGDGQGDLAGHGGEHRAVFVYQIESYRYWQAELRRDDFVYGQFGENFTVEGLSDAEVCIGDRYRVGGALFEVTQPRVTCYRVGIRMNEPRMPALLVAHHRPGFYFRVLEEGEVEAGDEIVKVLAGPEGLTVAETDALLYLPGRDKTGLERALRIPALERRLALLARNPARTRKQGRLGLRQSGPRARGRAGAGMGRVPAAQGRGQAARERERDLACARTGRRAPARGGDARPVHRAETQARARGAGFAAQLFALGRTKRDALADQRQAGAERRGRDLRRDRAQGRRRHRRQRAARRLYPERGRRRPWSSSAPASAQRRCSRC